MTRRSSTYWYAPIPAEVSASRISLDFGLRHADLFFRELVVPGLGRVWFARQLSWPLAALALHEEMASFGSNAPKPTAICHGIEALACKLEYVANPDHATRSRRILGSRAFGRDEEDGIWSFRDLRLRRNYVQNTHRQAATHAVRIDGGLGFARGSRFDLLELRSEGIELANAFLDQPYGPGKQAKLRGWLSDWILGEKHVPDFVESLRRVLSPESPSQDERDLVRHRLLDVSSEASQKRKCLASVVGHAESLRDIDGDIVNRLCKAGHDDQAKEIRAARAFGAVLDRSRDVVARLTRTLEPARGGVKLATLAADSGIKRALKDLRSAATNYMQKANAARADEPTSHEFADKAVRADDIEAIEHVVRRAGGVLALADRAVVRGALFRVVDGSGEDRDLEDGSASIEPDRTGRTFRIANFHELLRDVDARGGR